MTVEDLTLEDKLAIAFVGAFVFFFVCGGIALIIAALKGWMIL